MNRGKAARTVATTALLMALLTLGSKFLGFVREMVMAGFFGTSYITDSYVMALAIPSIIFAGFFSAINTAYLPLYSRVAEKDGTEKGLIFTSQLMNIAFVIAAVSAAVGVCFSDQIVSIFASGFTGEKAELTSKFLKISFSYALFTSQVGLLEAYLRYKNVFLASIIIGYIQNAIVILVIFISAIYDHELLALGWLLAYIVQLIVTWYISSKFSFRYTFTSRIGATAKKVAALSLPVFVGSYIHQINVFIDKTLASRLPEGSVAALNYGNLLVGLITGLTISIMMTVIYPKMTQAQALEEYQNFNKMVSTGFNLICIIAIPFSLGAMLYSQQIVQIIYERGAFDPVSTALTSTAFLFYSAGMLFTSFNILFTQTYYSMHDMKTPMVCGAIGVIINVVLNLILVRFMAHGGLALATSIASICNAGFLYYGLRSKYQNIRIVESKPKIRRILFSAIISVVASFTLNVILSSTIWMPRAVLMSVTIFAAMLIYLVLLRAFKIEELRFVSRFLRNKTPS